MVKIYVDAKETKRRKQKAKEFFDDVEIKQLEFGDYVGGNCAIEWKTAEDFLGSIRNKRIFKQAIGMKENYPYHYILVYGSIKSAMDKLRYLGHYFSVNQYLGTLASLAQITSLLWVDNENQAFKLTKYLIEKSNDDKNREIMISKDQKNKNKIISVVMIIGGMNSKRATKVVEELKINSLEDLLKYNKDDFMEINGIGNKTANLLIRWLHGE